MPRLIDLTGQRFGLLTVVRRGETRTSPGGNRRTHWECICNCGAPTSVWASNLRRGQTLSCGCFELEFRQGVGDRTRTHGDSNSPEYYAWSCAISRCENPNSADWPDYGGRGITMCARWRQSYSNFLADMGRKPSRRHSIERLDVSGNYEPGNCVWATMRTQQRNRRNNRMLIYQGVTLCLSDWASRTGIGDSALRYRIKTGWSVERALTTPVGG